MSEGPVVVGTDGSSGAAHALLWAAQEAALRQQPLHIVYAVDLDLAERLSANTSRLVREAARSLLLLRVAATVSHAAHTAVTLVVGSRGLGGFSALLLGSVGLTVAAQTTCPVVVVRGAERPSSGVVVVGYGMRGIFQRFASPGRWPGGGRRPCVH
ncbi:universal stress protein [Streptomyces sp. BRA346]|uniref:universal stress protein n=1 Tax=Streptomyces sp. BRA346 TaxID=2878199 RepID=UPI004062FA76